MSMKRTWAITIDSCVLAQETIWKFSAGGLGWGGVARAARNPSMGVNYATLSDAELRNENEEVPDGGISETAEEQLSRHHEIHLTDATRGNDIALTTPFLARKS